MKVHLYVKRHNVTGLQYFGKTTKDPYRYSGSGLHWKRHLARHGDDVTTTVIGTYTNEDELVAVATAFSIDNNIVASPLWANLIVENGLDGKPVGAPGHSFTEEQRSHLSSLSAQRWKDPEYRQRMVQERRDRWVLRSADERERVSQGLRRGWTEERKRAHSEAIKKVWRDPNSAMHDKAPSPPRSAGHNEKIAASLRGRPKSNAHRAALSVARNRDLLGQR